MCRHSWIKVNDVSVCKYCGLTFSFDGKVMFDRRFADVSKKAGKKRGKK